MSFNTIVPNAAQSPGLFPVQNNTNFTRLKAIVSADHVFNDSGQATDGYHNQMTMVARASPSPAILPAGSQGVLYNKLDGSNPAQLWYYDGTNDYQITPSPAVISGSVTLVTPGTYVTVSAIPPDVFGEIFFWKGHFIQAGTFVSDGSIVNGFSYGENFDSSGSSAAVMIKLAFDPLGVSGLNLRVTSNSSGSFNGVWNFKLFYRSKA